VIQLAFRQSARVYSPVRNAAVALARAPLMSQLSTTQV